MRTRLKFIKLANVTIELFKDGNMYFIVMDYNNEVPEFSGDYFNYKEAKSVFWDCVKVVRGH